MQTRLIILFCLANSGGKKETHIYSPSIDSSNYHTNANPVTYLRHKQFYQRLLNVNIKRDYFRRMNETLAKYIVIRYEYNISFLYPRDVNTHNKDLENICRAFNPFLARDLNNLLTIAVKKMIMQFINNRFFLPLCDLNFQRNILLNVHSFYSFSLFLYIGLRTYL